MPEHQQTQRSTKSKTTTQRQATPRIQVPSSHPMAIIQRARMNPKSLTHADVMQLQRTIGNQAVIRLFSEIGMIPSTAKQALPVQRQEISEEEEPLQGKFESGPEKETCPSCMQRQEIPEEEEPLQGKMIDTIQRQEIPEEEEPLQGKFENKPDQMACPSLFAAPIAQGQEIPEEEALQGKFESIQRQEILEEEEPLQTKREYNAGMPDNLKTGVENLSGIDMSDVRVHYNSSKPAEVGALAYTQGTNIHVAPGQEKHLPHEAWHVVQQKQGRVQATTQMKGLDINDDPSLEHEADIVGSLGVHLRSTGSVSESNPVSQSGLAPFSVVQRETRGMRVQSDVVPEAQELLYTERWAADQLVSRDQLKQDVLDNLGKNLQNMEPKTPHVATSLTGGSAYVAMNCNSKMANNYGAEGKKKNYKTLIANLIKAYKAFMNVDYGASKNNAIRPWIQRYKDLNPTILPPWEELNSRLTDKKAALHAEQFITKSIVKTPPHWTHKGTDATEQPLIASRGYRVIRIGGTLMDCARCHADHHGNMQGFDENRNVIGFNPTSRSPIFVSSATYGGTDAILKGTHGRIIRSTGMHPSADSASPQHPETSWIHPKNNQDTPFTSCMLSSETQGDRLTEEEKKGVRLPAVH